MSAGLIDPRPGAALNEAQAQRIECLRVTISLVAGRSVPIQVVERLARWLYSGEAPQ